MGNWSEFLEELVGLVRILSGVDKIGIEPLLELMQLVRIFSEVSQIA